MIRIACERPEGLEGAQAAFADLCEEFLPLLQADPRVQAYAVPGRDLEVCVVLGGAQECLDWDAPEDVLGFHAVISGMRQDPETGVEYHEVNTRHEAFVNLDAAARNMLDDWFERPPPAILRDLLATVPHEILHVLEWIRETGGLTPDEVYSEEEPGAIGNVLRAIEARMGGTGDDLEDAIEELAKDLTSLMGEVVWEAAERLHPLMAARSPVP